MKRLLRSAAIILLIAAFSTVWTFGASLQLNGVDVVTDVDPVLKDSRMLLPARAMFEEMGAKVDWQAADKKVTIVLDDTTIELFVDQTGARVNGVSHTLDVPAQVVDGRTLVPTRFVVEALGFEVNWNPGTMTANVIAPGYEYSGPARIGKSEKSSFFTFTINSAYTTDELVDFVPEGEGFVFLVLSLTVNNTSIYEESIPIGNYDYYIEWGDGDDEWDWPQEFFYNDMLADEMILEYGKSVTGDLVFIVPEGASNFNLVYEELYEGDEYGGDYSINFSI